MTLTAIATDNVVAQREFLQGLAAAAARTGIVVLCLPAPQAPLEVVLDHFPEEPFCLWDGPDGGVVGVGALRSINLDGPERLTHLLAWCRELSEQIHVQGHASGPCPSPRLLGGIAFAPGSSRGPVWKGFPDGYFVLPRWTYVREPRRAFLYLAVTADEARDAAWQVRLVGDHSALCARLEGASHSPPRERARAVTVEGVEQLTFSDWERQVEAIRRLIHAGTAHKIVTARRADVTLSSELTAAAVLRRMATEQGSGTRFGVRLGDRTFLGLTPETLFRKSSSLFATHALAGTALATGNEQRQRAKLLGSSKDCAEHAFVVDEIRSRVQPLCAALVSDDRPRVHRVRQLLHLETHFAGELTARAHAVELLAALHPTPAVGGTPAPVAVDWILANEVAPRGWYSGAVGWLDLAGDGTFSVAIRSGVLAGARAHAFAGAGIVESSDARAEYRETAAKQEPFLWALDSTLGASAQPRQAAAS